MASDLERAVKLARALAASGDVVLAQEQLGQVAMLDTSMAFGRLCGFLGVVVAVRSRRMADAAESLRIMAPLGVSEFIELRRQLLASPEAVDPGLRAEIEHLLESSESLRVGPVRAVPKAKIRETPDLGRPLKLVAAAVAAGICVAMALTAWRNSQGESPVPVVPRRSNGNQAGFAQPKSPSTSPPAAPASGGTPSPSPSQSPGDVYGELRVPGAGGNRSGFLPEPPESPPQGSPAAPKSGGKQSALAPDSERLAVADALARWFEAASGYQSSYSLATAALLELSGVVITANGGSLKQLTRDADIEARSAAGGAGKERRARTALAARVLEIRNSSVWDAAGLAQAAQTRLRDASEVPAIGIDSAARPSAEFVEVLGERVRAALEGAGTLDQKLRSNFACDAASLCLLLEAARVLGTDAEFRGVRCAPDRVGGALLQTIAGFPAEVPQGIRQEAADVMDLQERLRGWKPSPDPFDPRVWYAEAVALRQAGVSYEGAKGNSPSKWLVRKTWEGVPLAMPGSAAVMTPASLLQGLLQSPAAPRTRDARLQNVVQRTTQLIAAGRVGR